MALTTIQSQMLYNNLYGDASGNIGIGTSSPAKRLAVQNSTDSTTVGTNAVMTVQAGSSVNSVAEIGFGYNGWSGTNPLCTIGYQITSNAGVGLGAITFATRNVTTDTAPTERMRIDSSGNLLVGTTSTQFCTIWTGAGSVIRNPSTTANTKILEVAGGTDTSVPTFAVFYNANNGNMNTSNSTVKIGQMAATGRSINATGSINANGADYAEYMTKAGDFTVAKGDVVGINADGKLTNVFSDAISFAVKSTAPSYVGGDTWGSGFDNDPEGLEAARQLVDRIAFCGQVPVNVLGATAGQFIIPVNDNGAIKGEAVSNPTFEQYQIAVGKVIAIEDDGRARIIVKVA